MITRPAASSILVALALAGCARDEKPKPSPPDWHGATMDGIAPLMTPREVKVALERHRYRQVPCAASGRMLADPLSDGDESGCFRASQSEMTVSLYFRGVGAQRRLAVASFRDLSSPDGSAATRLTRSRHFAEMMSRHLGRPSETRDGDGYRTLYWRRPGGDPDQPDMIATSIGSSFGRNAELTSMWAYRDPSSAN